MGIQIGNVTIVTYYGIIIMVGAVLAALLAAYLARRQGLSTDLVWDVLIWVLIGGIIGARLWHIFTPPPSMIEQGITTYFYLTHPLDAINIRNGGLGIPGAVIGGFIALYLFCRRKHQPFAVWADIAAPPLALGQAIGRWGNYFNQELYGAPTNLPWAITIDPIHRLPGHETQATYHPLFLYESIYNLLNMFFLLWLGRKYAGKLIPGDIMLVYLITYPLGRFFLDFIRLDASELFGINANQTFMLVVACVSSGFLIYRHWKRNKTPEETPAV